MYVYDQSTHLQVGVGVNEDLVKLHKDHGLRCEGYHDVGLAGGRIIHQTPFRLYSMRRLVEAIWGIQLNKAKRIRCG